MKSHLLTPINPWQLTDCQCYSHHSPNHSASLETPEVCIREYQQKTSACFASVYTFCLHRVCALFVGLLRHCIISCGFPLLLLRTVTVVSYAFCWAHATCTRTQKCITASSFRRCSAANVWKVASCSKDCRGLFYLGVFLQVFRFSNEHLIQELHETVKVQMKQLLCTAINTTPDVPYIWISCKA